MRATWIVLVILALLPGITYRILDWVGATESLRYISTTVWKYGDPSATDLALLAASLFCWIGAKALLPTFLLAAVPFLICDIRGISKQRKRDRERDLSN